MTDERMLLPDRQAATFLGVSAATLWRGIRDGRFPKPIKIGGATRWRKDELVETIERASARRDAESGEAA